MNEPAEIFLRDKASDSDANNSVIPEVFTKMNHFSAEKKRLRTKSASFEDQLLNILKNDMKNSSNELNFLEKAVAILNDMNLGENEYFSARFIS